jgi:prevent-host-death family protein
MTMKKVPAAEFKAECLALLDRVSEHHETYVVTKHGRPVAQVVPIETPAPRPLAGSVQVRGDIVAPVLDDWDADA